VTGVLVCEDAADMRALLRDALNADAKLRVVGEASDGHGAVRLAGSLQPDVVLLDIGMPGMDGYEFIRAVRSMKQMELGSIPAVALTAFARSEDRTKAMLAGYQVHIAKPIEAQELVATVGSLVRRMGTKI
jgi:CheY-like chemotaxis protein